MIENAYFLGKNIVSRDPSIFPQQSSQLQGNSRIYSMLWLYGKLQEPKLDGINGGAGPWV